MKLFSTITRCVQIKTAWIGFRIETLNNQVVDGLPDGDLSRAEKQHLKGAFRGTGTKRFIGNIIFTIKSHKKAGQFTTRNIHALVGSPLAPLGKCVATKFKEHLNSLDHLVKDSIDLTNCLSHTVVPGRLFSGRLTSRNTS